MASWVPRWTPEHADTLVDYLQILNLARRIESTRYLWSSTNGNGHFRPPFAPLGAREMSWSVWGGHNHVFYTERYPQPYIQPAFNDGYRFGQMAQTINGGLDPVSRLILAAQKNDRCCWRLI